MFIKICKYCVLTLVFAVRMYSATSQSKGIAEIQKAIKENKPEEAERILLIYIQQYTSQQKPDSLVNYIFSTGEVTKMKYGAQAAAEKVDVLVEKIKHLKAAAATLRQSYLEAGEFYGSTGMNAAAYRSNEQALAYTLNMPQHDRNLLALVENNLATYAQRMSNLNLSAQHSRKAIAYLSAEPKPDPETLYIAYNGMGAQMWYASKTDSALYFFNAALEALKKTKRTARNEYYRPAVVLNNLSALYQLSGNTTKAIQALESTIHNLRNFINADEPDLKKTTAITFQLEATDNLAGFYKEIGDYSKAKGLLEYSYRQKQKVLAADDPAIFISQILLGQLQYAMRNYDNALPLLLTGLKKISASDGDYLFWQADACNTLALLHDAKHDAKTAANYFERADSLYQESLQGAYDNIYLGFLRNAALFYAENGQAAKAKQIAGKGYQYVVSTQGTHTLVAFYQLLNLSEVYATCGNPAAAKKYAESSIAVVDNIIKSSDNLLDSVRMELKKPKAILEKSKATYQLLASRDRKSLTTIWDELHQALEMLERQKSVLSDPTDISMMMADNHELIEFIEQITIELYNTTHEEKYLNELVALHESSLYNRIRARLDRNDSLRFANIPQQLQKKEYTLKAAIATTLNGDGSHDEKMNRYLQAVESWNQFQEQLRIAHPRYYDMRYASIFKAAKKVQQYVPADITVVRYFYLGKNLYALVADNKQATITALGSNDLAPSISSIISNRQNEGAICEQLFSLYQKLWQPLEKNITHNKIVVIPDGVLHNLNFEILTPQKSRRFKELATKSLLAKYCISYNYSIFLLHPSGDTKSIQNNFVAFAPGFSDEIKSQYKHTTKDSFQIDNSYLSLLPQPFSISLANRVKELFGGHSFLNESSTKDSFRKNAGNNRIIHIGTHAESDNDHPEFSRLIFAKNLSGSDQDNSLFVDEIYNCNLTSDLAVLTACESGRPGYRDGEGMISLAHAFNYAGSESIVTGLWKIDEQSSAQLLSIFYENLLAGMDKDEALRKAKLSYLETASGRMLAPQYWAGLVIMGDTTPVVIEHHSRPFTWILFSAALVACAIAFAIYRRKKRGNFSRRTADGAGSQT